MAALVFWSCAVNAQRAAGAVERDGLGDVSAELSYTDKDFSDTSLRISRAGTTLFDGAVSFEACPDGPCAPTGSFGSAGVPSVKIAQLDGSADPEIVVSGYTRGAHCCFVAQVWNLGGGLAAAVGERVFGNAAYVLKDVDSDGVAEFWSSDDRFSYRFASYASSGRPLRVLQYAAGGFSDVTLSFRSAVQADAARFWRIYRQSDRPPSEQLGIIAAWAADQYRLGHRTHARVVLRRETRARRIAARGWRKTPFVRDLDRFLTRLGYRRP